VGQASPDHRLEIAWGDPERGPHLAKTFRLDEIDVAAEFAAWINSKGCNVYVGATLKCAGAPGKGRTRAKHAALATCLPVDIDGGFVEGVRKLGDIARPQLLVLTGSKIFSTASPMVRSATSCSRRWAPRKSTRLSRGPRRTLARPLRAR
jgi:hypothetical protein